MNITTWSGTPDPFDPDNFWIDDETDERVDARTGERFPPVSFCPVCGNGELIAITQWTTQSNDDPNNTCELTEYQCTACNGRPFWK